MYVEPLFLSKILEFIDSLVFKARVKINGQYREFNKFTTRLDEDGKTIRIYFYIEEEVGLIEEAQVLTANEEILHIKKYDIEKDLDGIILTFAYRVLIEETDLGHIE